MFTYTTDGIVVENIILYNILCIQFILFCFNLIGFYVILFNLFQFIMFIELYPDVVGNYVMRLYDVIKLYYGRWDRHYFIFFLIFIIFYFILFFLFSCTLMLWVIML